MERKKIWSKKEVFQLIARYKHYRELWDTRSIEFRDTFKRRKAENKLAAEFKTTVAEIGRKIRILRSQFFYEYKKMYDDEAEDGSSSTAYVTKWAYYRPLQFILVAREDNSDNTNLMDPDKDLNEDLSTKNDNDPNDSNVDEDSDSKIIFVSKKRRRSDSSSESSDQSEQSNQVPNDEYQIFGNYVASELRSMHYEKNIRELKRLIQQHIVRCTEEDDREYLSKCKKFIS